MGTSISRIGNIAPSVTGRRRNKRSMLSDRLKGQALTPEQVKQNTLKWRADRAAKNAYTNLPGKMQNVSSMPAPAENPQIAINEAQAAADRKAMNSPDYVAPTTAPVEPALAPAEPIASVNAPVAAPMPEPAAPTVAEPASPTGGRPGRMKRRFGSIFGGR